MISEESYRQLLEDKKRLSAALKKLQAVSQKGITSLLLIMISSCVISALLEFAELRKNHNNSLEEIERLRLEVETVKQEKLTVENQLNHAEFLVKKLTEASRDAISEFKDLKERYVQEVERRKAAEQLNHELKLQQEAWSSNNNNNSNTIRSLTKSPSGLSSRQHPQEDKSKELAIMKVQLEDTLAAFNEFKVRLLMIYYSIS